MQNSSNRSEKLTRLDEIGFEPPPPPGARGDDNEFTPELLEALGLEKEKAAITSTAAADNDSNILPLNRENGKTQDDDPAALLGDLGYKLQEPKEPQRLKLICMDDVKEEEVNFLWEPYIPLGKITIVQGDPGCGKTFLALQMAAIASTGGFLDEPFNAIYQSCEDGLGDTIKSRLVNARADCKKIFVIDEGEEALTLDDVRLLEAIKETKAKLAIIDPLQGYIGRRVDFHRANEVRPLMSKLGKIAENTGCAVVLIGHMNKTMGGKGLYRGLGSIDIAAAARSVLLVGEVPNQKYRRAICHIKSSLAPVGETILFDLDPSLGFLWAGNSDLTADDILNYNQQGKREAPARSEAEEFLKELLSDGKMRSRDIETEAKEAGINIRTLRVAREKLGIICTKGTFPDKAWYWQLD